MLALRLTFFQAPMRDLSSRLTRSSVRSSATVRMITPPESFGSSVATILRSRTRSSRSAIFRLTPTFEAKGMYTRKRPASEIWRVTREPLVPMGSLVTCTRTFSPLFTWSWMFGSLRTPRPAPLSDSIESSSGSMRSDACRKALFSAPMSTNAACIPGRTASTLPR